MAREGVLLRAGSGHNPGHQADGLRPRLCPDRSATLLRELRDELSDGGSEVKELSEPNGHCD